MLVFVDDGRMNPIVGSDNRVVAELGGVDGRKVRAVAALLTPQDSINQPQSNSKSE